jgi:GNAT superfamily N-acetyltransferase
MENEKNGFVISTDRSRLDLPLIHSFLTTSYWAAGVSAAALEKSLRNSLCFGLYHGDRQVGFARVLTDFARSASLGDVFVVEEYRGRGLGKWLVRCVLDHPDLRAIPRWLLATRDAHGLYRQFGFRPVRDPERFMEKVAGEDTLSGPR